MKGKQKTNINLTAEPLACSHPVLKPVHLFFITSTFSSQFIYFSLHPLFVIVSQRLVKSRSETKIWTLSMCVCLSVCLVWHLLLIVLQVKSCPLVYGLATCSSSVPRQNFFYCPTPLKKGGVQKFTMVSMGKYSMLLSLVPATVAAASCLNL